tara:strand:- start:644 stop:931 length:288 start_codon:yes stop_codon:yes gene_type:complete
LSITSIQEIEPGTRFSFYAKNENDTSFWSGVFVLTSKTQIITMPNPAPLEMFVIERHWTILFDPEGDESVVTDISAVVKDDIIFHLIEGASNEDY